ncbi:UDP-glucose dehydrogenase family protein [Romboutsia lituseburensis]|uniref:UDP-glucose 6-dehydrogenase n=1 Tax=Romboutsia lituseburensis DSM 797 TaxID=1121325 RepID=A0A1G9QLK7_9FIRM|nr:UDP-glucose/GDP-mannose dehydrogenase family protein [Romboutsia lituseburensis]CEH35577.1 UDP-glucose 6-dehydrogenase YwqF [Romboutsia lituseburensis]SDM11909.1 UDPglucose 6-dehydrogenase [Romboutsia lituseburensis DSM 797]
MKIAIAGTGYVGLVTGVCLAEVGHDNVVCVDIDENKVELMKSGKSPIYEADLEELMKKNYSIGRIDYTVDYQSAYKDAEIIMIAVGTPERKDGSANLDYIKKVAKQIASSITKDTLVVIKSTVPIGTNQDIEKYIRKNLKNNVKVEVASNPEFLSQGTAVKDTLNASRIVIGVESLWAQEMLEKVYKPFNQPIVATNRNSAEMIKYASNDFLALKISFMNDIANLCEIVGANIEDVALGMSYDERIGSKFLKAGIGYGGSCFPKDTKALHWLSTHNGYELKTIKAAIEVNECQKLRLVRKASRLVESFEGMKVAVLGLTFKPGTDDLREAPSITNIEYLVDRGANVIAYDPVGIENTKKIFKENIKYTTSIDEAIKDAEACFIMTEWKEIINYDVINYKEKMKKALIFDGRNCYKIEDMKNLGIEYYSIGR